MHASEWERERGALVGSGDLSDIHTFLLANVLRRPILVYGDAQADMAGPGWEQGVRRLMACCDMRAEEGTREGRGEEGMSGVSRNEKPRNQADPRRAGLRLRVALALDSSPTAWGLHSLSCMHVCAGLTGVYLPLLAAAVGDACWREPVPLLFSRSHFSLLAVVGGSGPVAQPLLPLESRPGARLKVGGVLSLTRVAGAARSRHWWGGLPNACKKGGPRVFSFACSLTVGRDSTPLRARRTRRCGSCLRRRSRARSSRTWNCSSGTWTAASCPAAAWASGLSARTSPPCSPAF